MKILLAVMTVMFLSITNFYCTTNKSGEMKETADEQTTTKTEVVKPQYEITAFQKGAELGKIVIELFPDIAPKHCANFDSLVKIGFYDGTAFHRVMPGFMIQGGDPNSKNKPKETWGIGDPSQKTVPAEFSKIPHKRGILSTARKGNDVNSATSQFFIMVADYPSLDGQYTVFGKVLEGMETADKIVSTPTEQPNRPIDKIEMKIKRLK
ncbi:MAG: peptidylprolyl isomerase [bacterium]